MTRILLKNKLDDCIVTWRNAGYSVLAPVKRNEMGSFSEVQKASDMSLDLILPERTIKDRFFPQTEPMIRYKISKQQIDTETMTPPDTKSVCFGVRPCDAAGLEIDDPLFGWDYKDQYWFKRRNNSVIVTITCTASDDFCMCTSVKLSPESTKGSDVMLRPLSNGNGWQVETITERGKALFDSVSVHLSDEKAETAALAQVPVRFNVEQVMEWLANPTSFESQFWKDIALRCIGCGSCTFLCPTCHCFDIQDEGDTYNGIRRKNWDSCSFANFTMHTSGHNPRNTQSTRWRQRIMHKFNYYRGKFGVNSCSGCGRCTRQCPVDMGITETLQAISNLPR
ncbi:MAG: 4Fe-4S ferredoxin [Chlorobiaceae bacterium]|nr:4Fe-4S ferredoxin [Chlorobiaceae bacterium]